MMNLGISSWGIRTRVIFLAIFPIVIVASMLAYYTIENKKLEIKQELNERGRYLVDTIAPAFEFGVITNNKKIITTIAKNIIKEKDVAYIGVFDNTGSILYQQGEQGNAINVESDVTDRNLVTFRAPVYLTGIRQDALNQLLEGEMEESEKEIIGWIRVSLATDRYVKKEKQVVRDTLQIVLAGLLVSFMLALLIGNSVIRPIKNMMNFVLRMTHGELSERLDVNEGGEIGRLQKGINIMAKEMEASHADLQLRIADAVADLQSAISTLQMKNQELNQAKREAMQAKDAKSEFLANMSHEIRTPLNAVIGFSRQLAKHANDDKQIEYTRTINRAVTQLLAVIDDILVFSKLDSGNVSINATDFSVREYLEDIVSMLSPAAHEKNIELVLLVDSDMPDVVNTDSLRLTQVLTNLLNNAIKFTDEGSIILHARLDAGADIDAVMFSVIDTGIGINENAQKKLFRPFYQEDSKATRKRGGTGLGLAISKQLVEMMGGAISFVSEVGKGTTFDITVPVGVVTQYTAESFSLSDAAVYLLDTNHYSRRALRNNLVRMNLSTFSFSTSHALLDAVSDSSAQQKLVIISVPPGDDIFEWLTPIREGFSGQILCLVSGIALSEATREKLDSKTGALVKPVRVRSLMKKIAQCFGVDCRSQVEEQPNTADSALLQNKDIRVLVAEDNQFNRLYMRDLLDGYGLDVDCVNNGKEAINACMQQRYDIVFMDLHMPDLSGLEAVSIIRDMSAQNERLPIIAITADVFANDDETLLKKGFTDCIYKPVDEKKLIQLIVQHCNTRLGDFHRNETIQHQRSDRRSEKLPADLVATLINNLWQHCHELDEELCSNDEAAARETVHKLYGLVCYFELDKLNQVVLDIQQAIRSQLFEEAQFHHQTLTNLIKETVSRLRHRYDTSGSD